MLAGIFAARLTQALLVGRASSFSFALVMLLAIAAILQPAPARSADGEGRFAIKGVGLLTCQQYVEAQTQASPLHLAFLHWADGFLTAVNRYEADTYDITPWQSTAILDQIFLGHCRENPDEPFVVLLQKLGKTIHGSRLEEKSDKLNITVDGNTTRVYQTLVRRAQAKLKEQGFYDSAVDGQFGPKTQEAFATFQIAEGITATGLPDPLTLWRLLGQ